MDKLEKAHKLIQNILLSGEITMEGRALTMTQLSQLVSSEILLYNCAAEFARLQNPPIAIQESVEAGTETTDG